MGIRGWTATQISEGGTHRWALGMFIKLSVESAFGFAFGILLGEVAFRFTPVGALKSVFGTSTKAGLMLFLGLAAIKVFTHCKYTDTL